MYNHTLCNKLELQVEGINTFLKVSSFEIIHTLRYNNTFVSTCVVSVLNKTEKQYRLPFTQQYLINKHTLKKPHLSSVPFLITIYDQLQTTRGCYLPHGSNAFLRTPFFSEWFNLQQLVFSDCAGFEMSPELHHCVVIFFWSTGIIDCTRGVREV